MSAVNAGAWTKCLVVGLLNGLMWAQCAAAASLLDQPTGPTPAAGVSGPILVGSAASERGQNAPDSESSDQIVVLPVPVACTGDTVSWYSLAERAQVAAHSVNAFEFGPSAGRRRVPVDPRAACRARPHPGSVRPTPRFPADLEARAVRPRRYQLEPSGPQRLDSPTAVSAAPGETVRLASDSSSTDRTGAGATAAGELPPTPAPSASFLAGLDPGEPRAYTPDMAGAVGSNHLMAALSTEIRIHLRSGELVSSQPLRQFWAGVTAPDPDVYDPRLTYDPFQHRWIFVAVANFTNNPGLLLAVSQGPDPTGTWYRRFMRVDDAQPLYAVGPTVGFSSNRVVVQANMYYKTNHAFYGSYIWAFTKADLYAGGSGNPRRFQLLVSEQGGPENAPVPAATYDRSVVTNYFVGNLNGDYLGFGFIRLYALAGPLGAESFAKATAPDPASLPGWAHYPKDPAFFPQAGTTNRIQGGDCRIQNVVLQNGTLWAVQTVFLPSRFPSHSAIQWWEVTPGAGVVMQLVQIEALDGLRSYAYPSIAVNDAAEVLVGFTRFWGGDYPSACFAMQTFNDPAETMRELFVFKMGDGPFEKADAAGRIYWGAWSSTVVDPANFMDMWTLQEFAAAPSNNVSRWGAWWARASPPVNLVLTMNPSVTSLLEGSSLTYRLAVSNANWGLPCSGVRLTNPLPAGVEFLSAVASQGSCTVTNQAVVCELGTLGYTNFATVTLALQPWVPGPLTNAAFAAANGPDDVPSNNVAQTVVEVLPTPDLAAWFTSVPVRVNAGQEYGVTLVVTNQGAALANNVQLTNMLWGAATFISAQPSQGSCSLASNRVSCALGSLAAQSAVTISLVQRAGNTGTWITNWATAHTSSVEARPTNNASSVVTRLNVPPTIQGPGNQTMFEDGVLGPLSFTVNDAETPASDLVVSAWSSDPVLVQDAQLLLGGTGTARTLTITPQPNQFGVAIIRLAVSDPDGARATNSFELTVQPVNDPPTLDPVSDLTVWEDTAPLVVNLTGISTGPANERLQTLTVTATSDNPALIPHPTVNYVSPNPTGTITLAPAPNGFGTARITVTVQDNGGGADTLTRTFTVTVLPVNDPPTLDPISDLSIEEDAGLCTVWLTGVSPGPGDEPDPLTFSVSNSNPALLTNISVSYSPPGTTARLSFGTVSNAFGQATLTVTVDDGHASNNLVRRSFTVTVVPVNDPPTLDPIPDLWLVEDGPAQAIPLTGLGSGAPNESQTLTVTTSNSNPALITGLRADYTGTLRFGLVPNASGQAVITVRVSDGGLSNNITVRSFTVTVAPVNDPPTLDPLPDVVTDEDAGPIAVPLTGISSGAPDEVQTLTVTVATDNPALIPSPTVQYSSPASTGSLRLAPAPNAFGSARITVTVNDGGLSNNLVSRSFTVTVNPINDPPTLDPISDLTVVDTAGWQTVPLTGISGGPGPENDPVRLSVSSSRPDLLVDLTLDYTSPASTGTLRFRPILGREGQTVITVTADDTRPTNNITVRSFTVTVIDINDPPTLDPLPDLVVDEDCGPILVPLTGISSGAPNENQTLTVTAVSDAPGLIPNPIQVQYISPATTGTLKLVPAPNAFGQANITVTVDDGGASNNLTRRSFTVQVRPVNDPPAISEIPPQATDEDTPLRVSFWIGDVESPPDALVLEAFSSNEGLVPNAQLVLEGSGTNRALVIQPLTNQVGGATIFLMVTDPEGATTMTYFELTVLPVNDPPHLSPLADRVVNRDGSLGPLAFTVGDVDSPLASVAVWASSSDPVLVPDSGLILGGQGAQRTLTVTPTPGRTGTATISVWASDGQATNRLSFRLLVNGPPTVAEVPDQTGPEDQELGPILLTVGDVESDPNSLAVSASSSNLALVAAEGLLLGGAGSNRTLRIRPQPDQTGITFITVTVTDPHGLSASRTFRVRITPVNDPPYVSALSDRTINQGAVLGPISFTVSDPESPAEQLVLLGYSSRPELVPDRAISFSGSGANRTFTVVPTPSQTGAVTVTIVAVDPQGASTSRSFALTVNPVNQAPVLIPPPNVTLDEDGTTGPLPLVVSDPDSPADRLIVTASSSNPALVPNTNLVLGGAGADRTITITPLPDQSGNATITLTVRDERNTTASASFTVTVNPVNDPPTLDPINDLVLSEDAGPIAVPLTGISKGAANEADVLTVSAVSSNPSIIPHPVVTYSSPNSTGTLTLSPLPNATGTVAVTVTVRDTAPSNNVTSRTFTVRINPVNDPPSLSDIPNHSTPEGTPISVPFVVNDPDTPPYALSLTASSSNPTLVPTDKLFFEGSGTNRTLQIVPVPFLSGTATITVTASDGAAAASKSFVLTVTPVNDPPTLDPILDVGAVADVSTTVTLTGISSGATNETERLTLTVSNSNPALFSTQPTLSYTSPDRTGTLTFKVANNKAGAAVVTVTVTDDGTPVASSSRSFTVYGRLSGNSPPSISAIANQTINEDAVAGPISFTVSDSITPATLLTVTGSSSNKTLVPDTNLVFGGSGANRILTVTPAPNQFGTSIITVAVTDTNFGYNRTNFVLVVNPVNDPPVIGPLADLSIEENGSTEPIPLTVWDVETPAALLSVTASSANPTLVPQSGLQVAGYGTNRVLVVTPAADQSGSALITVTASDGATNASRSFTLTVSPVNRPPSLTGLTDVTLDEDTVAGPIPFTIGDRETPAASLVVSASSSNPTLLPTSNVAFGGSGSNRTVTFRPLPNQFGTALVQVTVTDAGGASTSAPVLVTVRPVNDPPTLDGLPDLWLNANASPRSVLLTGISAGPANETQPLAVWATSDNPALIPQPIVNYTSPSSTGTLVLTVRSNVTGQATITVTVCDLQPVHSVVTRRFTVTVNGPPRLSPILPQVTFQDTALPSIPFQVTDDFTPAQAITLRASSANPSLIPEATIAFGGSGSNRTVTLRPASGQVGSAIVTIQATDSHGASATRSFPVVVRAKNRPPTLDPISDLTIPIGSGPRTVTLTGISAGDGDAGQSLSITARSSDPALIPDPTVLYTSPATTATLQLVPPTNTLGTTLITVTLEDNGGTEGGGQDTFSRSFRVTVVPAELVLQIVREADGRLAVLWRRSASNLVLQANTDLRSGTSWFRVQGMPQIAGEWFKLVVPSEAPAKFFRLAQARSSPAAPVLQVRRNADGQILLLWSQDAADYILETTDSLTSPRWSAVSEQPSLADGQLRLTLPASGPARLFRLRLPEAAGSP